MQRRGGALDWSSVLQFDVDAAQQLELVDAQQSEQLQQQMLALSRGFLEMSLSAHAAQVRHCHNASTYPPNHPSK